MVSKNILFIVLFALVANQLHAQSVTLIVDELTSNQNLLIKSNDLTYVSMSASSKKIKITCDKEYNEVSSVVGNLSVTVNSKVANSLKCNNYASGNIDEEFCTSKSFDYDLAIETSPLDHYKIECSVKGKNIRNEFKLYKLYDNSIPYVRSNLSGIFVNPSIHNIQIEQVICETVVNELDQSKIKPNGVQWYTSNTTKSFELPFESNNIIAGTKRISNIFKLTPLNQNIYVPSNYYRCCTILNKTILSCLEVYLSGSNTSISELTTTKHSTIVLTSSTTTTTSSTTKSTAKTTTPKITYKPINSAILTQNNLFLILLSILMIIIN